MGKRNGVNAHLSDAEAIRYSRRANSVAIRRADDNVVAVIEIVSPGNKSSRDALRAFTRKAAQLLHAGVHLLIVDLFPPSKRDPQGIHKAIWDRLEEAPFTLPPDKPLTVASYSAGAVKEAYVDPVAVGDPLPDMPIFLTPTHYILCPLESTYQATWDVFPAVLKGPLEAP